MIAFSYCTQDSISNHQEGIDTIFTEMEANGIDTDSELLYGFYFLDENKIDLEVLMDHLKTIDFKLARLEKLEDSDKFMLHVEKVAVFSRETLYYQELEMMDLAKRYNVETYDGWDVGNPDPTKPLVPRK